ncbi:hypothetical protein RV12_GL002508 [Enterococcus quebecensis]|uniref:Uncharacterized protein n=1 Tax=Enterococcus quebecensis TaxID=903983 RepID=A0A1E5GUD9_9ENTE|nr:hypothetical protein BCR23_05140 [Enterococcus quebecensis]OJG74451.1 hypothetical protein RV12_GL002508 [Enterococcus quebecensis]
MLTIGIANPKLIFYGIYIQVVTHHSTYQRLQTITEKSEIPFLSQESKEKTIEKLVKHLSF